MGFTQQPATKNSYINQPEDTLHWRKDRKLSWDDFQGIPDTLNDFKNAPDINSIPAAGTSSGFAYYPYYTSETILAFKVNAVFFKKKSWVRKNWVRTKYALNHEQRHFDITEIYARRLQKALNNCNLNKNTIIESCKKIYDSLRFERDKMQALYDIETRHSLDSCKQREWDKKIDKWLAEE